MKNIFGRLLSSHIIITIIIMIMLSLGAPHGETIFIIGVTSCVLYFYSGYILTKEKVEWYNYFGVACLGIFFWLICFVVSPHSMNYKRNPEAGIWFLYQVYIIVSSPLNFIESLNEKYSLTRQLITDFLIPIVISVFQFFGGWTKMRLKD